MGEISLVNHVQLCHFRLPHFLVIGTQRGGTTSLQKLLEQHPDVYLPSYKEVHYFTLHAEQSVAWYSAHYTSSSWEQQRGDITPYYLFHPEAPRRIFNLLPRAKLIVLLRDPVNRALSQFFHARRHGFERLNIRAALEAESERLASGSLYSHQKHSYMARSCYLEQMDRYEALFSQHQILVLRSEDLFQNPGEVWRQIQHFLQLRYQPLPIPAIHANAGQGEASALDPEVKAGLRAKLANTVAGVRARYGFDWNW